MFMNIRDLLNKLSDDDLEFMRQFLLASGSLKELAKLYGISYPTIRIRLDKLIQLIELHSQQTDASPLELEIQAQVIRGNIDKKSATKILTAYRESI